MKQDEWDVIVYTYLWIWFKVRLHWNWLQEQAKLLCNPLLIKQANSVQIKLLSCKSIVYCATTMLYNTTNWLIQRDPQNQWNEREKKKGIKSTEQWQDFITRFLNSESATSYTQYSQCIFISYSLCSFAVQWVILLILMEEKIPSKS